MRALRLARGSGAVAALLLVAACPDFVGIESDEGSTSSASPVDSEASAGTSMAETADDGTTAGPGTESADSEGNVPVDSSDGTTSMTPTCGDGVLDEGEGCDQGKDNSDTEPDACRTNCEPAGCGDGVTDAGEACDDGSRNSDTAPDGCRMDCAAPACSDGVVDTGEDCDDANADPYDGCSDTCALEVGFACNSMPSECGPASILINGDFEDDSAGDPIVDGNTFPFFFPGTGVWFADAATFVGAEEGITPLDGAAMLRFDATSEQAGSFSMSNIEQGIDMAPYATPIAADLVTLEATASFNRVETAVDSLFRVRVAAYSGSAERGWNELAEADNDVSTDLDAETWEAVSITLPLPPETTFVLMSVNAIENEQNNSSAPEFLGHYADSADLRIIVAPPS